MILWQTLWRANALLLALMVGCAGTPRILREEAQGGETLLYIPRSATVAPVAVTQEEATEAIRRMAREVRLPGSPREAVEDLFQFSALYGDYLYLPEERQLIPLNSGTALEGMLTETDQNLAHQYKHWCRSVYGFEGDCLGGALVAGKYLDMRGRYMWAMAMSKSPVLEEFERALGKMVSMDAVLQAAMWTVCTLLFLLALPEPVTKFLAAWAAVALVLWIGATTLYSLIQGWFQLMKEVRTAVTFKEIREAGEKFGKLISQEAARAFAMIAMAALSATAQQFASKVATLPGSAEVAMQADAQGTVALQSVTAVKEVAVTAEGFRVVLPQGAVAMAAQSGRGEWVHDHHIATLANDKSPLRGGPWTPRFRRIFAKAGMSMKDPENIAPTMGHRGPHPERYHQIVLDELETATRNCQTMAICREKLTRALRALAKEIVTPGTELNQLVTRTQAR
jgi:hypothetical protein